MPFLEAMLQAGLIEHSVDRDAWQLNASGLCRIVHTRQLGRPQRALRPRQIDLSEMTTFELVLHLECKGFQAKETCKNWRRKPYIAKDATDHDKKFYAWNHQLHYWYLRCLADHHSKESQTPVPHGASVHDYKVLLGIAVERRSAGAGRMRVAGARDEQPRAKWLSY